MARKNTPAGYGNIYTPHAGSMVIQVQREGGLANRTIILTPRQVKLLRWLFSRRGVVVATLLATSWVFFAVQAARVPVLTGRISSMQYNATRLDTLQLALDELQKRYIQVQSMLSASGALPRSAVTALAADSAPTGIPSEWPLAVPGYVTRGSGGASPYSEPHPGIDIAVPVGTEIRAAGPGTVVEVGENEEYGRFLRVSHGDGYETLYGHTNRVLAVRGQKVAAGAVIALSGNTGTSTAPHLHFEVRQRGTAVDPLQLIKRGQ